MGKRPAKVALKGLSWDYLSPKAQESIRLRVEVAERNVIAAAEAWAELRFKGPEQVTNLRAHMESEGFALGTLLDEVGYLNTMR